jgi:DNA modification methylase
VIRLLQGDCRDVLATLPADSVHCVVTSVPYYGLRDYGCAGQIGLEATPDEWLATLVGVFREVRRVMRPDATLWLNVGDAYASSPSGSFDNGGRGSGALQGGGFRSNKRSTLGNGYKAKDLLMMPARLAIALQQDGWWVRSDIIWAKPNPMPESVTDRPTSAHEHVFLLAKQARYFYDGAAVAEPSLREGDLPGGQGGFIDLRLGNYKSGFAAAGQRPVAATRNLRNVWTIATEPFPAAHYAVYPTALVERCIKAGTSERGCCAQCGAPRVRQTDKTLIPLQAVNNVRSCDQNNRGAMPRVNVATTTTGWAPSCTHNADVMPCTVLDPFVGSGTTCLVADRLQRDAIGIDLNTSYAQMAVERCRNDAPLLTEFEMPPAEDPEDTRMADLFAELEEYPVRDLPKPHRVPAGWDTGPGAHGTIHRTGRTLPTELEND